GDRRAEAATEPPTTKPQTEEEEIVLGGERIVGGGPTNIRPPLPPTIRAPTKNDVEMQMWEAAKRNDPSALLDFLSRYPDNQSARAALDRLKRQQSGGGSSSVDRYPTIEASDRVAAGSTI